MDSSYLQTQRYLLQKKFRRLNSCDASYFHSALIQFWNYVADHPLHKGTIATLNAHAPEYQEEIDQLVKFSGEFQFCTEEESAWFAFRVVQFCASKPLQPAKMWEVMIGRVVSNSGKTQECLDSFISRYLEPFYETLDEALDSQKAVLSFLLKYKRTVEWFEREEVAALLPNGETKLARHLYAYLFDQGLDFQVEPKSASGEVDLVSKDLVLDAKIFDGDSNRGKRYIRSGLTQVLAYLRDFNQPVGYLAIYRTCQEDLHFDLGNESSPVPFITVGGKTVFFLVVDICDYGGKSASKRGTLKAFSLTATDLRELLDSEPETQGGASVDGSLS
ncbi:hypothetical protein [Aquabacterium sp.]|uniref:hypothetical protein n=1 Tax=Aquabacterium sp. TaxID=1872578 RepID=UPI0035C762A3